MHQILPSYFTFNFSSHSYIFICWPNFGLQHLDSLKCFQRKGTEERAEEWERDKDPRGRERERERSRESVWLSERERERERERESLPHGWATTTPKHPRRTKQASETEIAVSRSCAISPVSAYNHYCNTGLATITTAWRTPSEFSRSNHFKIFPNFSYEAVDIAEVK